MIELKEDQLPALDGAQQPPVAVDPRTGQEYLLVRRDVYGTTTRKPALRTRIASPATSSWDANGPRAIAIE